MAGKTRKSARDKAQQEFVSEAEELLDRMRDDLSALAEANAAGREVPAATLNQLFRSAHTLKGSAGMFGHASLAELAHHLEDILDRLRMGRATLGRSGLSLLDESVSLAGTALEKVGNVAIQKCYVFDGVAELVSQAGQAYSAKSNRSCLCVSAAHTRHR
jgi:two-component system chemotaxis sensor kinase CheA